MLGRCKSIGRTYMQGAGQCKQLAVHVYSVYGTSTSVDS